jgi:hypothetical protein
MRPHRVWVGKHFARPSKVLCRDARQGIAHFPFLIACSLAHFKEFGLAQTGLRRSEVNTTLKRCPQENGQLL